MEVSTGALEPTDHIHVGGKKRGTMQISDSVEFYHLLSESLYSNKELAAVREIICNGWDAHIASGKTDIPLDIKITDEGTFCKISIRDFGTGIPDDEIIEIYGIYGNSTKRKNDLETGGFGLGSKAPFAVTGHFNVLNHHNGKKTMYKVIKDGSEGKPDVIEIFSTSTDQTGIEVSFNIDNAQQFHYKNLIESVVFKGGILSNLNGNKLPIIDWDQLELPVLPIQTSLIKLSNKPITRGLYIKLGNVLYPVEFNKELYKLKQAYTNAIKYMDYHTSLIVPMPGSSVRVTPSRESISYNEFTNKNLIKYGLPALNKFNQILSGSVKRYNLKLKKDYSLVEHMVLMEQASYDTSIMKYNIDRLDSYVGKQRTLADYSNRDIEKLHKESLSPYKLLKRIHRLLGYSDLYNKPFIGYKNYKGQPSLISTQWYSYGEVKPVSNKKIIIGYSKKQLVEYLNKIDPLTVIHNDREINYSGNYLCFIRTSKDTLDESTLNKEFTRYGMEIVFLEKPITIKKSKPVQQITLSGNLSKDINSRRDIYKLTGEPIKIEPEDSNKYYTLSYQKLSNGSIRVSNWIINNINILEKILGKDILLIHGPTQGKLFKESGFIEAKEVFEKLSSKWLKSKELLILLHTYEKLHHYYGYNHTKILPILIHSKKLLKKYVGISFKTDPVYDDWISITEYMSELRGNNIPFYCTFMDKIKESLSKEYLLLDSCTDGFLGNLSECLSVRNLTQKIFNSHEVYSIKKHQSTNINREKLQLIENLIIKNEATLKELSK